LLWFTLPIGNPVFRTPVFSFVFLVAAPHVMSSFSLLLLFLAGCYSLVSPVSPLCPADLPPSATPPLTLTQQTPPTRYISYETIATSAPPHLLFFASKTPLCGTLRTSSVRQSGRCPGRQLAFLVQFVFRVEEGLVWLGLVGVFLCYPSFFFCVDRPRW